MSRRVGIKHLSVRYMRRMARYCNHFGCVSWKLLTPFYKWSMYSTTEKGLGPKAPTGAEGPGLLERWTAGALDAGGLEAGDLN